MAKSIGQNLPQGEWHGLDYQAVMAAFGSDEKSGLTGQEAMDRLEQSLVASEAAPGIRAVEPVFRQTMALLGQIVADLQATVGAAMRTGAGHRCLDVCEVIHCDKGRQYERALHQTVEVLMNTKNAFKSKELGELRKSLVQVLKQQGGC